MGVKDDSHRRVAVVGSLEARPKSVPSVSMVDCGAWIPLGGILRAHTEQRRETEVDVAAPALNRMLELGGPNYVRTS